MIHIADHIRDRVRVKEDNVEWISRCHTARVCPKCGEKLNSEYFNDGGSKYDCVSCDYTASV